MNGFPRSVVPNLRLDVRTKLALTLSVSTFCVRQDFMTKYPGLAMVCVILPALLMIGYHRIRAALIYSLWWGGLTVLLLPDIFRIVQRGPSIILSALYIMRVMWPGYGLAYILFTTTSISEFLNGMNRMHVPRGLVIALAVVFRFWPTVRAEYRERQKALRMCRMDGMRILRHPVSSVSYRLIPLVSCCARIGDELSMSALCRGLSLQRQRTRWPNERFRSVDILFFAFCLLIWICGLSTVIFPVSN